MTILQTILDAMGCGQHKADDAPKVEVGMMLQERAAGLVYKLDWRHSVVDLMKLLGIDSSIDNRRKLSQELGYDGDMDDSAKSNEFLLRAIMKRVADNGGRVPSELLRDG